MNITLNHGSGGKISNQLINNLFLKYFNNEILNQLNDSAIIDANEKILAYTTDSYVVEPIFFPGGNIGKLSICGTVNDLAVSGAIPRYISASFILEEGFDIEDLEKIIASMSEEAEKAGVMIVTGDTKVVPRGKGDKIYINTSGIGFLDPQFVNISSASKVKAGDKIIVNGNLGDHAIAILASRESLHFETTLNSDCASLNHLIQKVLKACPEVGFIRDITRGGLATIANELADKVSLGINLEEDKIPVSESTMGICEIFGFDPLFLANEGKILLVVPSDKAETVINLMKELPESTNASIIGEITENNKGKVILNTLTGGKRLIEMPAGVQLPRIC
jgi:hydrogenase expression/formation protein HypE